MANSRERYSGIFLKYLTISVRNTPKEVNMIEIIFMKAYTKIDKRSELICLRKNLREFISTFLHDQVLKKM